MEIDPTISVFTINVPTGTSKLEFKNYSPERQAVVLELIYIFILVLIYINTGSGIIVMAQYRNRDLWCKQSHPNERASW